MIDPHICRYCGVETTEPDEDCYKAPHRKPKSRDMKTAERILASKSERPQAWNLEQLDIPTITPKTALSAMESYRSEFIREEIVFLELILPSVRGRCLPLSVKERIEELKKMMK